MIDVIVTMIKDDLTICHNHHTKEKGKISLLLLIKVSINCNNYEDLSRKKNVLVRNLKVLFKF